MSSAQDSHVFNGHFSVFDDQNFHVHSRTLYFVVVIFVFAFLVAVALLYSRWFCHRRGPNSPHAPHAPPPLKQKGLDPAVIRALPIVLYQSSGENRDLEAGGGGGECCICLGVFQDGEKVKVLPDCRHWYHSECVDTWLATQSNCPLCRSQLRADDSA